MGCINDAVLLILTLFVGFVAGKVFFTETAAPAFTPVLPFFFELYFLFGGHVFPFFAHALPEPVFKLFFFMGETTKTAE